MRRKAGRPRIHELKEGRRIIISVRVTRHLKQMLDEAAAKSGRSQSQEAAYRLERTFQGDDVLTRLDAIERAIRDIKVLKRKSPDAKQG